MTTYSLSRRRILLGLACALPLTVGTPAGALVPQSLVVGPQRWTRAAAAQLLGFIENIDSHGLDRSTYGPGTLREAIQRADDVELERIATATFGLVARDLAEGRVRPAQRARFYIAAAPLPPMDVAQLIDIAIERRNVAGTLDMLAPHTAQYTALRAALAGLPAGPSAERQKLEASLERWRWMPRQLGARHLLVNIPEFRLRVMVEGTEVASHKVIVGKPGTPTPQFTTSVTGVILNPTWNVPQSIVAESIGRLVRTSPGLARERGYTWSSQAGRLRVTQRPGPQNALGQMKLDMPNPYTVFVHDTSNRELFAQDNRALSHGCIRTEAPFALAARLLGGTGWTPPQIEEVVAGRTTTRIPLAAPFGVYTVYMTAYARPDGTIAYSGDPYALDATVVRLLHTPAR